jgi:Zn-finger nucleic acid-binding protein
MLCPACGRQLQEIQTDNFVYHICKKGCNGILINNIDLKKILEFPEVINNDFLSVKPNINEQNITSEIRTCPKCQKQKMVKNVRNHVGIDECYRCGNIWLDAGNFMKIREHYNENQTSRKKVLEIEKSSPKLFATNNMKGKFSNFSKVGQIMNIIDGVETIQRGSEPGWKIASKKKVKIITRENNEKIEAQPNDQNNVAKGRARIIKREVYKQKSLATWFVPEYNDLTLYMMALTFALQLLLLNFFGSGISVKRLMFTNIFTLVLVPLFILGFIFSVYHVFVNKEKSKFKLLTMVVFAVVINLFSGIMAGMYFYQKGNHPAYFLIIFWCFYNNIILIFKNDLDEYDTNRRGILFGSIAILFIYLICLLILSIPPSVVFIICLFYANYVYKIINSIFASS